MTTKTLAATNDGEETNLEEALLTEPTTTERTKKLAPGELEDAFAHWSPCKRAIVLLIVMIANCATFATMIRRVLPPRVLPLQGRPQALSQDPEAGVPLALATIAEQEQEQEQESALSEEGAGLPPVMKVVKREDSAIAFYGNNNATAASSSHLRGPLPPFHPHHSASVTYSSRMGPDGSVEYRRDINAPCEFGMLLFTVGPAKDDLPYTYELYNDAYLYSDNNGLCMFYPSYNGYQTSPSPLWNPTDPLLVVFQQLDQSIMHWISSRVYDPHHSKKKWDRSVVGDYAIIAKYNFYDPNFYKSVKAQINSWK